MSRICEITGKKPSVGNTRSHAMNAKKRRFNPNLTKRKIFNPKSGRMETMRVSVAGLRTLIKRG
ncbi:50S ribosomal protein L28 [Candidatus Peregrinibacteria bacterium]|nr:50S ribosomal protein L28 [Candidatus Peregrinibacteria bacterium]